MEKDGVFVVDPGGMGLALMLSIAVVLEKDGSFLVDPGRMRLALILSSRVIWLRSKIGVSGFLKMDG